jgi:hypothetical protein
MRVHVNRRGRDGRRGKLFSAQLRKISVVLILCVLSILCGEAETLAQTPDFSGTWKLNRPASQIATGAGISGLGAGGVPPTLYISQAANGTVVVGSDINESHARTFRLVKGAIASDASGVKESLSLSADGQTLTVQVSATTTAGSAISSTLRYVRVEREEPCERWPTPCRYR